MEVREKHPSTETLAPKKATFDPWLLIGYAFLASLLWLAVFYVTGAKWWNHPLSS